MGSDPGRIASGAYRSFWDSLVATGKETALFGTTGELLDFAHRRQLEQSPGAPPALSADQANQLYPYMPDPFTSEVDPRAAAFMAERALHRMELQGIIDQAPHGALAGLGRFGTQLAVGMLDPVNLLTFEAGGAVLGATKLTAGIGSSFARRAANMAIAGAPLIPMEAGLRAGLNEPYSAKDALMQGVVNPIAFSGLHEVVGAGVSALRSKWAVPPAADAVAGQSAVANMGTDRAVESERVIQQVLSERAPPPPEPSAATRLGQSKADLYSSDLSSRPMRDANDVQGRRWFHAAEVAGNSITSSAGMAMDRELGGTGIYLTDNPFVAHGHGFSKFGSDQAGIFEAKIDKPNVNLLDLERNLPEQARKAIESAWTDMRPPDVVRPLATAEGKLKDTISLQKNELDGFFKGKNGLDVIHALDSAVADGRLPADALHRIDVSLKAAGFDGFRWDGGALGGAKSNMIKLFDPNMTGNADGAVSTVEKFLPDHALLPDVTPEDVKASIERFASIQSDAAFVEANHSAIQEKLREGPKPPPMPSEALKMNEKVSAALADTISESVKAGLPENVQSELAALDEASAEIEKQHQIQKAAAFCVGGGGGA
jgi:hypothetical protein